jgi:periplasmic copper chaperone A
MKKLMFTFVLFSLCSQFAVAQPAGSTSSTAQSMSMTHAQATPAPTSSGDLTISGTYVQPLIPGQTNTAAYMTINNQTQKTYVLTGADSPMAQKTELHTVLMQDGIMKMRPVEAITLLPGQNVVFQPGDFHIMLIDVNTELNKDTLVPICLEFKESDTMCLQVPVIDKRGAVAHDHQH